MLTEVGPPEIGDSGVASEDMVQAKELRKYLEKQLWQEWRRGESPKEACYQPLQLEIRGSTYLKQN